MGLTNFFYLPANINYKLKLNQGKIYIFSSYESVVNYYNNDGNEVKSTGCIGYILQSNGYLNTVYDLNGNEQFTFAVIFYLEKNLTNNEYSPPLSSRTGIITSSVSDIKPRTTLVCYLYSSNKFSPTQIIGVVPDTS